jgi:NitT/TauT family transport system substrate-binding protein
MYVAAERGFFDAQGININFEHGFSEVDGRDRLAVGDLQFAILSGEQVIIGRSAEQPIVYVMEWYHRLPVGVVVPADSEIEEPGDLEGQTVAVPNREGANYTALMALLESVGLSEDDIALQEIGFTAPEVMCAEQVDAAAVYIANEPLSIEECFEVRVIEISDYTSLIANGMVTNEETLQDDPELVRGMVQAWLDGVAYTIEHPDEAFEISLEHLDPPMPEDQYERQRQVLAASIELWRSDNPGQTTEEAWLATQDILLSLGLIDEALDDLGAAYTNEFLPDRP